MEDIKHLDCCDCPGCGLSLSLLDILNSGSEIRETMQGIVRLVKSSSQFEIVGLRLAKGDDFPFYCSEGMDAVFLEKESSITLRDKEGNIIADEFGYPSYECLCGMVLSGRKTNNSCFTEFGSFWTNDLPSLKGRESTLPAINVRHTCSKIGCKSLALLPVKVKDRIIGLLHIGDSRSGMFTSEMVKFLERAAVSLGVAFARMKRMDSIQENLNFTSMLIEVVPVAIFYKSRDGRYLGCNSAFEKLTGLNKTDVLGKSVYEIAPKPVADVYYRQDMELFMNPGTQIYEATVKKPDGAVRNVIFHKATFFHADGTVAGLVGGILDITDAKEKIGILQSINKFSHEVIHEINNIILIAKGNSQLMMEMADDYKEWKQDAASIFEAMTRAEALAKKIREFGSIHKIG